MIAGAPRTAFLLVGNLRRPEVLVALLVWTFANHSLAQKKPKISDNPTDRIELSADSTSRDYETRSVILEGNVFIAIGSESLTADRAVISLKNQEIEATGNVVLEGPLTHIEGQRILYNYKTKVGRIEKGLLQAGSTIFMGELIRKDSDTKFLAEDAYFTTCATCPPGWSFTGSSIEADIGGYAYIKNPVLRFGRVPVLYLPRLLLPLKNKRQTGLLVPQLGFSNAGGAEISLPYFWAIRKNQDATFFLKAYEVRGIKQLAEYRFALDRDSHGELDIGYLRNDEGFTVNGAPSGEKYTLSRSFVTYTHLLNLPDGFSQRANFNIASDLRYPRDFDDEMSNWGDPALENSMSLSYNSESYHASLDSTYYVNLLQTNERADNSNAVHRTPEINFNYFENELGDSGLFFRFDLNYTNFSRRNFSFDDVVTVDGQPSIAAARDGEFDPTNDQIRTGQRVIIEPHLSYPYHVGNLFIITPSVTYNESRYRFDSTPTTDISDYTQNATRRYLETDIAAKTKYTRVFDSNDGSKKFKHEIEPELIYSRVPWLDRSEHIFFGNFEDQPSSRLDEPVSNNDFYGNSKIQFDYRDRIFEKDFATFVFTNYLIRRSENSGATNYKKLGIFRIAQSYDFNNAKSEDPHPWSPINSLLEVQHERYELHTTADYYPYAKVTNWYSELKLIAPTRDYVKLSYTNSYIVDENNDYDPNQKTEEYGFDIGLVSRYFQIEGKTYYSAVSEEIQKYEFITSIIPPGNCWTIRFGQSKKLGADEKYKLDLVFNLDGI
jgi:LPS-assembly protein